MQTGFICVLVGIEVVQTAGAHDSVAVINELELRNLLDLLYFQEELVRSLWSQIATLALLQFSRDTNLMMLLFPELGTVADVRRDFLSDESECLQCKETVIQLQKREKYRANSNKKRFKNSEKGRNYLTGRLPSLKHDDVFSFSWQYLE